MPTPRSWTPSCLKPPPMKRPAPAFGSVFSASMMTALPVRGPMRSAVENRPTQIVPNTPFARCTERAPTGSSSFSLSNMRTANTTSTPATEPMITEEPTETNAQGAVIATRPARQPFSVMPRSGLPIMIQHVAVDVSVANAAAVLVVTVISPIARGSTPIVLPGLNPNQPNHRTKVPIVAAIRLWPAMGLTLPSAPYLPMRGPSIQTPTSAAQPPIECTWVEPAKSTKPFWERKPPPQIQCPTTG